MRGRYPDFKPPRSAIFCFSSALMKHIKKEYNAKRVRGFQGISYLVSFNKKRILVIGNFGIGAPVTVANMEEMIAFGIKRFLIVGKAGCLQPKLPTGYFVICNRAIRDDGTSHHYAKNSVYAYPSRQLVRQTKRVFVRSGVPHSVGSSWTMDAPYCETKQEVEYYRKKGVLTVEMEAAAVFSVAKIRRVQAGAVFTISDHLGETEWVPRFQESHKTLEQLFKLALRILTQ